MILPGIACLLSFSVSAGVVIMGTRVVYPAQQKSINVQLHNGDMAPSLVQAWMDTGEASAPPDAVKVPFITTPPVFRMDPKSGQTLRVMYTREALPQDRESLFYLNVLDIPAKPDVRDNPTPAQDVNYLQLAVRSRIKFFFRPDHLTLSPDEAYDRVVWSLKKQASRVTLTADNRTPYFITYSQIAVHSAGKTLAVHQPGMVAPWSSGEFPLDNNIPHAGRIAWTVINDYGGYRQGESELTQGPVREDVR